MIAFCRRDYDLYAYAINCSLSALIGHAARVGRGWHHFSDGEVIIAVEVVL